MNTTNYDNGYGQMQGSNSGSMVPLNGQATDNRIGFSICPNCKNQNGQGHPHRLRMCMGPLIKGRLLGCPIHETLGHNFDHCRDRALKNPLGEVPQDHWEFC